MSNEELVQLIKQGTDPAGNMGSSTYRIRVLSFPWLRSTAMLARVTITALQ
jgi:hypothetical protein